MESPIDFPEQRGGTRLWISVGERGDGGCEDYRFLDLWRSREIREAAAAEGLVVEEGPGQVRPGDLVCRFASDRVFVTRRTLRRMIGVLRGGADVAVAPLLEAEAGPTEVYTLSGFESVEDRLLAADAAVDEAPLPPVSLWRGEAVPAGGAPWPSVVGAPLRIVRCGLSHQFIDYYGEVRSDVLPFIPEGTKDLLEVGCARGLTGALVQREIGCRVTGIELNPAVAAEARTRLHRVLAGDIEELPLESGFDVVVALELVEHLRDPIRFVRRALECLKEGGRLILSTPNVGHYSVVADLMRGRWDYLPTGILCYTHLRFFTRRTLADWMSLAGCDEIEIVPQTTPLPPWVHRWAGTPGLDVENLAAKGFWVIAGRSDR